MSQSIWFKAGDGLLTLEDLKQGRTVASFNDQEKNAVQFCSSWLNGRSEFEFQTSGSTGIPKKITFTRDQLIASAKLTAAALHLTSGDTALVCLDVRFIAGAMMLVRSLVTGMNIIMTAPSANPLKSVNDPIDFAAFVPLQVETLLAEEIKKLNGIKTIIIGGATLQEKITMRLKSLSPSIYATYGMTETITHIALQKINEPDQQDCFHLLPGIKATQDDRGCLVIQAAHLGHLPVVTNDCVTLIDQFRFQWMGRVDRVINSGGIKIQPEKIEQVIASVLEKLNIRCRFFAAGIPDEKLGEKLVLVVEEILSTESESNIRKALSQRLPKYEVPQVILQLPRFLETSTQKVDRLRTLKLLPS